MGNKAAVMINLPNYFLLGLLFLFFFTFVYLFIFLFISAFQVKTTPVKSPLRPVILIFVHNFNFFLF